MDWNDALAYQLHEDRMLLPARHAPGREDVAQWLDDLGDPYTRTGADLDGRVAIDWGVYGVPETFVIDRNGRIAFKQVGPVTHDVWRETIGPLSTPARRWSC